MDHPDKAKDVKSKPTGGTESTPDHQSSGVTRGRDNDLHIEDKVDDLKDFGSSHHVSSLHAGNIDSLLHTCSLQMQSLKKRTSKLKTCLEGEWLFEWNDTGAMQVIKEMNRIIEVAEKSIGLIKDAHLKVLEDGKKSWKEEVSRLLDPGHNQMKREGLTNEFTKINTKDNIERFFCEEYLGIVEGLVDANDDDDFQADEILTKHMKTTYDNIKRSTVYEVCTQIDELFTYDPNKILTPNEEERLRDISHAYGLLLHHYRNQHENSIDIERTTDEEQDLDDEVITKFHDLFLELVTVSPPFVLFIPKPDHCKDGKYSTEMQEFVDCNNKQEKKPHHFHVRIPIILTNYLGNCCVEGMICKGLEV